LFLSQIKQACYNLISIKQGGFILMNHFNQFQKYKPILGILLYLFPIVLTHIFNANHSLHELVIMTYALSIILYITFINRRVYLFTASLVLFHILHDVFTEKALTINPILSSIVMFMIVIVFLQSNRSKNRLINEKEALLSNSMVAITEHEIIFDSEGTPIDYRFIYANMTFEKMTGLNKNQILGKTFYEVMPLEDKNKILMFASVVLEQKIISYESYNQLLDKYFSVTSYPSGKNKFMSIFTDITESKHIHHVLKQESERLNHVLDSAHDFIVELGMDQRLIRFYGQGILTLGFDNPNQLIGKTLDDIFGFVAPHVSNLLKQAFMGQKAIVDWDYSVSGETIYFESTFAPINYNDSIEGIVVITRNVTDYVIQKNKLEESHQKLQNIIEGTHAATWEYDIDQRFFEINVHYADQLGYQLDQLVPLTSTKFIDMIHPDDRKIVLDNLDSVLKAEKEDYESIYRIRHQEGHYLWMMSKAKVSKKEGKTPKVISGMSLDISARMQYEEKLEYYSHHDSLTGLKNRRFYANTIIDYDQPQFYPLSILMIDFNGLKLFNDAYGHDIGDIVLIETAKIIEKLSRKTDIACRIGGDEFVLILPNTDKIETEKIKQKIIKECERIRVKELSLSVSAGFAVKTKEEETMNEVIKRAENNMYKIKIIEGKSARGKAIQTILKTLNDKYKEEEVHSIRVSRLCKQMAKALQMPEYQTKELELAGLVHDIGKISIPDSVLKKEGRLTNEEYTIIKTHADNGYQILRSADEYSSLADSALYHHERWDGQGYPHGLKGEQIPYYARIISICDAYEAMTSDRSYRKAPGKEFARSELIKNTGSQFDPNLVKIFLSQVIDKEELT